MITMMGSMGAYMKNLKLQTQVEMKQSRGELGNHKSLTEYLDGSKPRDRDGENKDKLRDIHSKLQAGGKLTAEERRYLRAKDPEAYQKLCSAEQEQKAFRQKLRQCRTKEEAQRLKMTYISSSMATIRDVEHNSAIPQEKKLEIFMREKQRCDRIEETSREFVRRGDYERLPSEAEEAKARKDAQKAEEAQKPRAPERKEPSEAAVERRDETREAKPAVHVESREEKKVKKARANAGRSPQFAQAVAAYRANLLPPEAAVVDTKG